MKMAVTLFISLLLIIAIPETGTAQSAGEHSSFEWYNITLRASLDSIIQRYTESIVFLDEDVAGWNVVASCKNCSLDDALNAVLSGTSLVWIRRGNQIILKKQDVEQVRRYSTISGTVIDTITGEWIGGASVQLQDSANQAYKTARRWCQTNEFGFFSLPRVPCRKYKLVVRAMGYGTTILETDSLNAESVQFDIKMIQKNIVMQDVTVEGNRAAFASMMGLSRGVYHKSIPTDHNQYLLDGAMIYNPTHFGGVLSTFSPEVTNDVQVAVGGLPPSYGGRLGGVVDLAMREGSRQKIDGSLGLGFLGSNFSFEGPLRNNTTFIVAGRKGYPNIAIHIFSYEGVNPSQLGFSELVTKVTHRLSNRDQITLSGYYGRDNYSNVAQGIGERLNNNFSWGNSMLNLRWIGIVTPSLFVYTSAIYTCYDFNLRHVMNDSSYYGGIRLFSDYRIEDYSFHAHAESYYSEDNTIRGGVELIRHRMNGYISEFSSQIAPFMLNGFSSLESAVYLQDQWKLAPGVLAELGGRATSFTSDKGYFSAIDPRFSLMISLSEQTRLSGSISAINEFIHPYRNSGVFLLYPAIFWYPSTERMQPTNSTHIRFGLERSFKDDEYIVSTELYYKETNNLHEFGLDTIIIPAKELEDFVLLGSGKTYGITFGFKKRVGSLTGGITYNLSWSVEKFADINEGKEFTPPFNRKHELQFALSYSASGGWVFNALCVVSSTNSSIDLPKIFARNEKDERGGQAGLGQYNEVELSYKDFIDVNGSRLPGFQRLELSLSRRFFLWSLPSYFTLRFMNGYGLLDPYVWKLQQSNSLGLKWNATLQKQNLFPLYPSLEFTVRF